MQHGFVGEGDEGGDEVVESKPDDRLEASPAPQEIVYACMFEDAYWIGKVIGEGSSAIVKVFLEVQGEADDRPLHFSTLVSTTSVRENITQMVA